MNISPGLAILIIAAWFWVSGFACGWAAYKHDLIAWALRLIRRILGR